MKQYENILSELKERGVSIQDSGYDDRVMGSWFIQVDSTPLYRIVHDGRDKAIVLEVYEKEWDSLLADKTRSGKHAIAKLIDELKHS